MEYKSRGSIKILYIRDMYLFEAIWGDVKNKKNIAIPTNSIKIHGDDNLAVYKITE